MKTKKKKTNAKWRLDCVEVAIKIAKARDRYKCQKCGTTKKAGSQIQGSHILPKGRHAALSADPENIIALCAGCHKWSSNSWHESPLEQGWFHIKFPGLFDRLQKKHEKIGGEYIDYEKLHKKLKKQLNEAEVQTN